MILWPKKEKVDLQEYCVLCGAGVEYSINTPVDERKFYVDGCGQLCGRCFREILLLQRIEERER